MALTSCHAPSSRSAAQPQEIRALEESRVVARRYGDNLAMRFRLRGRDAYAVAALPDSPAGSGTAMQFSREARNTFSEARSRRGGQVIPVLGTAAWRTLSRKVAGDIAPENPRQCALVTTGGLELMVCRDKTGKPVFMPLTKRPRGVKIVRRISGTQLSVRLADALREMRPGSGPVLLLTGTYPALLYIDPATPRLSFISAPEQDMIKLPLIGSKPEVTMRGLLSVGVRTGVITTLKNPVTTAIHGTANLVTAADAAVVGLLPLPAGEPPPVHQGPPMDLAAWEKHLDRITGEPQVPATVRLRIGGEQFFPDFIQAIQEARESIDVLLYIFDTDDYAIQIADLLKQRSREVRVRVMYDEAASYQSSLLDPSSPQAPGYRAPVSITRYLRQDSNVEVRPMAMPALSANHTKLIIVDGRKAWLGGMNIGREYRSDWHDMMVEVTGPLIGWLQRSFAHTWAHNGIAGDLGELLSRLRTSRAAAVKIPVPPGAIPVRPLRGAALHSDLRDAQVQALRKARRYAWVENAYLADRRFIREMIKARLRGVDVRVLIPEENDSPIMKASNRALVPQLLRRGIRVWLLPEMSHVKAAIYDGWACIGSANYDRLSLRVNQEFNIGYSDPAAVEALRRDLFLKDMARGKEATDIPETSFSTQVTDNLLQALAGQL